MKKIIMLFAAAALVLGSASCQKENFSQEVTPGEEKIDYSDDPMGVIKVYIKKDDTKMAFEEKNNALYRSWEEGDVIDGCTKVDDKFVAFAYTVDEVGTDEHGQFVKLIKTSDTPGVPSSAKGTQINFVYAPGAVSFDETTGACSLDLSKQEEGAIPAVMVASGTVDKDEKGDPKLSLKFNNIAAVMAIRDGITLKDVNNTEVTGYTINKVYAIARTKGTLTLNNDEYKISDATPDDFWPTTISPKDGTTSFSADDPIYIAALPGNGKISAELRTDNGKFVWETSSAQNLGANAYARIKNKEYKQRAEAQIGETRYAIEDAFAKAVEMEGAVEIKMVENAEVYEEIEFKKESGKITLDLNEKTITSKNLIGDGRVFESNSPFEVKNGTITGGLCAIHATADLTLSDAKFYANGKEASAVINVNSSTANVVMNGCHIEATATEPDSEWKNIRAVNVGGITIIENCKLISPAIALRAFSSSDITVTDSELISNGNEATMWMQTANSKLKIESGYFYNSGSKDIVYKYNASATVNIIGGYFNKEVTAASGYKCTNELSDDEKNHDGKIYTHKVVETYEAKIGTEEYKTLALAAAAAKDFEEDVTIQMIENANVDSQISFSNTNNKKITLDLNGRTISSTVDFAITADTKLIVTDNSGTGLGKITSSGNGIIRLDETHQGEIIISNTTVEYTGSDSGDYAVSIKANSSTNGGKITIDDNAKIISNARCIYASYGSITLNTCELTAGLSKSSTAIYLYTGGKIYVSEDCSVVNESGSPIFTSGTGNSASELNIKGGWFYGKDEETVMTATSGTASYISRIFLEGGYFSTNIMTNAEGGSPTFVGNKIISKLSSAEKHSHGGSEYSYGYKVVESFENVAVKIGSVETKYETIDEAFTEANKVSEAEIILLNNCSTENVLNVENGKKVTLDLNGKTISLITNTNSCINVEEGAEFILKDLKGNGSVNQTVAGASTGYVSAIVTSGTFTMHSGNLQVTGGSNSNAYNYTIKVNAGRMNMEGGSIYAKRCGIQINNDAEVTIIGESLIKTSTTATSDTKTNGVGIQLQNTAKLTVDKDSNGKKPTIESDNHAAIYIGNGCTVTINDGIIKNSHLDKNTGDNLAGIGIHMVGGTATINGGVVYSHNRHTVYMITNVGTLNIHGGVLISKNASGTKDGPFVLYTTTSGKSHKINVDDNVSIPYFYGGGADDASDVKYQDRLLYTAYSITKSVKAGYTQKHYWVNKTNSAATNGGVDSGYSVVTLQTKRTFEFEGVTYEFGYQVQKNN